MRLHRSLTLSLVLGVSLLAAPGCAKPPAPTFQTFPSFADLKPDPKPVPPADVVTSEAAADAHDIALEAWGKRRDDAVTRICEWAVNLGAKPPFKCRPDT